MPYTDAEARKRVTENIGGIHDEGDLNFAITRIILSVWLEQPRYATLHMMRKELCIEPKKSRILQTLRTDLADRFDTADIYAAAAEAYHEFRDRVGKLYEAKKCLSNGDISEYVQIINGLMNEIAELQKEKEVSKVQLIVPGVK